LAALVEESSSGVGSKSVPVSDELLAGGGGGSVAFNGPDNDEFFVTLAAISLVFMRKVDMRGLCWAILSWWGILVALNTKNCLVSVMDPKRYSRASRMSTKKNRPLYRVPEL
jgi:hypothetical protein